MTEFSPHYTEAKLDGWHSSKTHCYQCGQGRIQGEVEGASPPPALFKHVIDEYNFSIISKLFDNNKPYALSTVAHPVGGGPSLLKPNPCF